MVPGTYDEDITSDVFNVNNTCRISLSFYNDKKEIDKLIDVLKKSNNIYNEIL